MKVQNVKRQFKLREWSEQIKAREASGLGVEQWCAENGIGKSAYYYRLKRVHEEILDFMETTSKCQLSGLPVISDNSITTQHRPLAFAPVTMTQAKGAAITVWIGAHAVDVQNGADVATMEQVLRVVSRL
jgi:hypothetical protein